MLKLLVFAAAVVLQIAPLYISNPAETHGARHGAQNQEDTPRATQIINNVDNRQRCDKCKQENPVPGADPDKWVRRGFYLNVGLLVATFVIAIVGAIQSKASLLQANHLVDFERAWILESISFPFDKVPYQWAGVASEKIPTVSVRIKNQGKSVARIRDFRLRFHTFPGDGKMPSLPNYTGTTKPQELGLNGIMQAPTEESDMPVMLEDLTLSREMADKIERRELGLWLYGFVEYETLGKKCTTQFCYVWTRTARIASDASKAGLRKGGPEAYNRTT